MRRNAENPTPGLSSRSGLEVGALVGPGGRILNQEFMEFVEQLLGLLPE